MLYYNTVTPLLKETLYILMNEDIFSPFRLVGGTNLSLRLGHRMSDDIDSFTEAEYGSLNFKTFESFLKDRFPYYDRIDETSMQFQEVVERRIFGIYISYWNFIHCHKCLNFTKNVMSGNMKMNKFLLH